MAKAQSAFGRDGRTCNAAGRIERANILETIPQFLERVLKRATAINFGTPFFLVPARGARGLGGSGRRFSAPSYHALEIMITAQPPIWLRPFDRSED
jgi:hypothetical protein